MPAICLYFQIHQPYRLNAYDFTRIGEDADYFADDFEFQPASLEKLNAPQAREFKILSRGLPRQPLNSRFRVPQAREFRI